jgi:RimJ/RimL family protein N-acetyltransferase
MTTISSPELRGHTVTLRPIDDEATVRFLYELGTRSEISFRWRLAGRQPTWPQYQREVESSSELLHLVAEDAQDTQNSNTNRLIGELLLYGHEPEDGLAYFGCAFLPDVWRSVRTIEAIYMTLRYGFEVFNLRKIYIEFPEFNMAQFKRSIGSIFKIEATLREHHWYADTYWDYHICALYRPALAAYSRRLERAFGWRSMSGGT